MASSREVHMSDLPPELLPDAVEQAEPTHQSWEQALHHWAEKQLALGKENILEDAMPRFERIMIDTALAKTSGKRQEAAKLLGWGRNTLTRKIKELAME